MVRLAALPQKHIRDEFKGKLDFYYWKGIPVARKWPHHRPRTPYPAEAANQALLAYAMRMSTLIGPRVRSAYQQMASSTPYRWQDLLVKGYIHGFGL